MDETQETAKGEKGVDLSGQPPIGPLKSFVIIDPDDPNDKGHVVTAPEMEIKAREGGGTNFVLSGMTFKETLLIHLRMYYSNKSISKETRNGIKQTYDFIKDNFTELNIKLKENVEEAEITYTGREGLLMEDVKRLLNSPFVLLATATLQGREKEFLKRLDKIEDGKTSGKLHRQPRNYLKTVARSVGRDMEEPNLFSLPQEPEQGTNTVKEIMSKKTAILGHLLLKLWQNENKTEDGKIKIENLASLGEEIGATNHQVKILLLYLGGYTYPIVEKDTDGGIILRQELLFEIEFKYSKEAVERYGRQRVGTTLASFIREAPVKFVSIKPNLRIINGLQGKGLKNVLVSDKFIKLALDVSDMAYKILTYSASNRPAQTIREVLLVNHLNLQKQIKAQGYSRIRTQIFKGFQELQDKKHIKNWNYDEAKEQYKFSYTDHFIKHKAFHEEIDLPKTGEDETVK